MPDNPQSRKGDYFSDTESAAEKARLLHQDRLITKGMNGVLSGLEDISSMRDILDIACGPGGWVLDVALEYPAIEVMGIDISQQMIDYANTQAQAQGFNNASFSVMDVTRLLDFPDNSFDLVNARFLGFLPKVAWPKLVQECLRITRPAGLIRRTRGEWAVPHSPGIYECARCVR